MRKGLLATLAVTAGVLIFGVPIASAHDYNAAATCDSVTFNYTSFESSGDHTVYEFVYVDGQQVVADHQFDFTGTSGGPDVVSISVPNDGQTHMIETDAWSGGHRVVRIAPSTSETVGPCGPPPTPPHGTAKPSCDSVTFNYSGFGDGDHTATEFVYVDGVKVVDTREFSFTGDSGGPDVVSINVPQDGQTHEIETDAWSQSQRLDGFRTDDMVGPCNPPHPNCPPSKKLNFRWHYSANGTSGSWSGTKSAFCPQPISQGPQAMEGNLQVSPGAILKAGYSFTSPGNSSSFFVTVSNAKVTFPYTCVNGGAGGTLRVTMPDKTYNVTNSQWYPSGDQHSPLVYQGQITVPNACGGGKLRFQKGGTFTANVS